VRFEDTHSLLQGIPYIKPERARMLYDFVLEARPHRCLELGFAHGASSCYIAAALDELGDGHLTTVDILDSAGRKPPIEHLLQHTSLASWVTVVREQNSYDWFLKKEIVRCSRDGVCRPAYDFCFIDGAKNWTVDGFAFFLVDKLLEIGGWILFDDLNWSYDAAQELTGKTVTDGIVHRELSADQRAEPNIALVFRYLVMQHPSYGEFRFLDEAWARARKVKSGAG
jgi:predicted O-methyltransferase YrrM